MLVPRLALAASLLLPAAASAARKPKIAVMEIRAIGADAQKAELLNEIALTEASAFERFDVIGKSDIAEMIGFEKQKKMLGCTDDANCIAEIGGALGVDYMLVGSLGKLGSLYRLDLKVIESKHARVLERAGETVEGSPEKLVAAIQRLVRKMVGSLDARLAPNQHGAVAALPPPPAGTKRITATMIPATPAPAAVTAPTASTTASTGGGFGRRNWSYVAGGLGVVLVGGGVVMGLSASSAFDAEKKASASGDLPGYTSNKAAAGSRARTADILYAAGAVGAGVGAYLFFTGGESSGGVAVGASPIPGGAAAHLGLEF